MAILDRCREKINTILNVECVKVHAPLNTIYTTASSSGINSISSAVAGFCEIVFDNPEMEEHKTGIHDTEMKAFSEMLTERKSEGIGNFDTITKDELLASMESQDFNNLPSEDEINRITEYSRGQGILIEIVGRSLLDTNKIFMILESEIDSLYQTALYYQDLYVKYIPPNPIPPSNPPISKDVYFWQEYSEGKQELSTITTKLQERANLYNGLKGNVISFVEQGENCMEDIAGVQSFYNTKNTLSEGFSSLYSAYIYAESNMPSKFKQRWSTYKTVSNTSGVTQQNIMNKIRDRVVVDYGYTTIFANLVNTFKNFLSSMK